jgi:DNA-binding transcriptional regulator YdaS (Cro superfamily)
MTRSERAAVRLRQEFRVAELAEKLGITPPAIYAWSRVPENRVAAVAKLTRIPRHELRPDLFKQPMRKRA